MSPVLNLLVLIAGYIGLGWICTAIAARIGPDPAFKRDDAVLFILLWPVLLAAAGLAGLASLALAIGQSTIPRPKPSDPILEAAQREVEEIVRVGPHAETPHEGK